MIGNHSQPQQRLQSIHVDFVFTFKSNKSNIPIQHWLKHFALGSFGLFGQRTDHHINQAKFTSSFFWEKNVENQQ